jgi:FkbM family methyltransferase
MFGTLLRDSARIIALSSPHRARLVHHYPEAQQKSVILPPPPLIQLCSDPPAKARKRARAAIGAAERDFVWIYWGYIYRGKGVETLLEAFRIACRRNANLRLALVGGNLDIPYYSGSDYFQMVQRLSETLAIADRVTWTGSFNWDSDKGSLYLHAGDACVLPFDYGVTLNNSSLAAASTHGLPVVGTELLEGRDEMLEHGRNIYLVRPRDPEMLAEAMEAVSESAALRERLHDGVRELARNWHRWETTTERLVDLLESAVSGGKAPRREQSQFDVAPKETESTQKRITSEMRSHDCDDKLSGVQEDNPHFSSLVLSGENTPENVAAPLVSVIVAAYNVEKYLSQCLDSLVNQTLKNIEIIVINDASTDNSPKIIDDYRSRYPNIRVFNCESNLGPASARNIGLRVAKGEYIGFTDGDDWADPRKYELMYRRAERDSAEILIACIRPFVEDEKWFISGNDQHIWDALSPEFKQTVFHANQEPRVFVMDPSVWAKLYKRSFLQEQGLEFEEGMNFAEDVTFDFAALWKAERISLLDRPLSFYRLNRPGQITGRTDRRILETFTGFERICQNLSAWEVSDDIWSNFLSIELRIFHWIFWDRAPEVSANLKREFFAACARQLRFIPEAGFRKFAQQAGHHELARAFYMRRDWRRAYNMLNRWPSLPLLYVMLHYRRQVKRIFQHCKSLLRTRVFSLPRHFVNKFLDRSVLKEQLQVKEQLQAVWNSVHHLTALSSSSLQGRSEELLAEVCRIDDQALFFCDWSCRSGLADAVWRMQNDFYLSQTVVFRSDDIVVDVGAHVGVISIYLAKKFPFITVYAIEPDPLNYACLKRNIELNGVTNVIAVNKAVTGDGQEKTLYVDPWYGAWATIDERMAAMKQYVLRTVQVESMTLDQLFQKYGIEHCRLLKMNTPGALRESLQSFTIKGCVDLLCGEADLVDCSRVQLEVASWRIARQHFWRTIDRQTNPPVYSWIHQAPRGIELNGLGKWDPSAGDISAGQKLVARSDT